MLYLSSRTGEWVFTRKRTNATGAKVVETIVLMDLHEVHANRNAETEARKRAQALGLLEDK